MRCCCGRCPTQIADRLVILWNRSPGLEHRRGLVLDRAVLRHQERLRRLRRGRDRDRRELQPDGRRASPNAIGVIRVSSNLLPMLGAQPSAGRLFVPEDDAHGPAARTAMLSHGDVDAPIRRRSIRCRPDRSCSTVSTFEIVGVLPRAFSLPREVLPTLGVAEDGEIFLPLPLAAERARASATREDYNIIGQLKPGVSVDGGAGGDGRAHRATAARLPGRLSAERRPHVLHRAAARSGRRRRAAAARRSCSAPSASCCSLRAPTSPTCCCRARSTPAERDRGSLVARRHPRPHRPAIARRERLLALAGGALGLSRSRAAGVRWIQRAAAGRTCRGSARSRSTCPCSRSRSRSASSTGVLFGLAPALGVRPHRSAATLKDASRGSAGAGAMWGRGGTASRRRSSSPKSRSRSCCSSARVCSLRSFAQLAGVSAGLRRRGVLTFELTMTGRDTPTARRCERRIASLWIASRSPAGRQRRRAASRRCRSAASSRGDRSPSKAGTPPPGEKFINADQRIVGGRYFEAMGIPLVRGEFFTDQRHARSAARRHRGRTDGRRVLAGRRIRSASAFALAT